jgi:DNA polymerase-3 subunit alpha
MENSDFCHLHVHNEYSLLDGYGTAKQYVSRAVELGFESLGLTNHGNISGLIKFQDECDKQGINPVLGCEAYVVEDARIKEKGMKNKHITLLVKNEKGWKNLCKLLSKANIEGFYHRPRISSKDLLNNCKGLVVMSACVASFITESWGQKLLRRLSKRTNVFLEVMPHWIDEQAEVNRLCFQLSKKYSIPLVATNDCHYVHNDEAETQEVLMAINNKQLWSDEDRFKIGFDGLHLKSADQMFGAFRRQKRIYDLEWSIRDIKRSIFMSLRVASLCSKFRIVKKEIKLPHPDLEGFENYSTEKDIMRAICIEGLKSKAGAKKKINKRFAKYQNRMNEELDLIFKKKFERYFLLVWDVINYCKKNNIPVGPGRGSVGGSIVAYLMGITTIDPIEHDLLFSRFINEDRIDYPDIDIDFAGNKRHLVQLYLEKKYGAENIYFVSTFMRMKSKAVFNDVCRVFGVPNEDKLEFSKIIKEVDDDGPHLIDLALKTDSGKQFEKQYPKVIFHALKLENQIRGYGQHAAAIVVSPGDLESAGRGNLIKAKKGIAVCWEKEDAEKQGLMKLDVLGVKVMAIIDSALQMIEENHGKKIDLENLELNDKRIYRDMNKGNTEGGFQINTWAMTKLIDDMVVENFNHLCDASALVRPGPANSGMTAEYIKRKHTGKWKRKHKIYEEITRDTYGIVVYQEQVMAVIHKVAGLPYNIADKIRKIIGKKRDVKEFEQFKKMFIDGCLSQGYFSRREAEGFWAMLQEHASYSFNKSHSCAYSILGYWTLWLKHYYANEFICASLTYGSKEKMEAMVEEAYRLGLEIMTPKIGISNGRRWVVKGGKLYIPFLAIKNIGEASLLNIEKAYKARGTGMKGFYSRKANPDNIKKLKGTEGKVLSKIKAYDPKARPNPRDIEHLFDFRIK